MPSNSTGTIAIWRDATNVSTVKLSVQESGARLRQIKTPTTVLLPPSQPTDGDEYEVFDADGSCSLTHAIVIVPPAGTTIRGAANLSLSTAFINARVSFDASADDWVVAVAGGSGPPGGSMISRVVQNIIGTETPPSGITIADNAQRLSAEVDALGNDTSVASLNLFVQFTSTATIGSVDVSIFPVLVTGGPAYDAGAPLVLSIQPNNGTSNACVNLPASRLPSARFYKVNVKNNGTGADLTDVFVGAETTRQS